METRGSKVRSQTGAWCHYCGAWQTGHRLPVLEPAGEPQVWHLCDYCWSLLQVGLEALRPRANMARFHERDGGKPTSQEVYAYIREGYLRGRRLDG